MPPQSCLFLLLAVLAVFSWEDGLLRSFSLQLVLNRAGAAELLVEDPTIVCEARGAARSRSSDLANEILTVSGNCLCS